MKIGFEAKIFAALLVFLLLAVSLPALWHAQKFFPPVFVGASLDSFDKIVPQEDDVCFSYTAYPGNVDAEKQIEASAIANNAVVFKKNFVVGKEPVSGEACFSAELLELGENRVDVLVNNRELFFNVEKVLVLEKYEEPELKLVEAGESGISFSVEQHGLGRVEPVNVLVNGELQKKLFALEEKQVFEIKPGLGAGENKIEVLFQGQKLEALVQKEPVFAMNPVVGIMLLLLGVFVFALLVFSIGGFAERLALSLGTVFSAIVLLVFALNYAELLSPFSFMACFAGVLVVVGIVFRKKYKPLQKISFSKLSSMELFAIAVFVLLILLFNMFSYHHLSYWTPYYERQTEALLAQGSIPTVDEYSYLGKGYTFVPGYFLLEGGISWLTGLQQEQLFGLAIALSNMLFVLSLFYFGKCYGFDSKKNALFYAFLCLSSFILTFFVVSPRHTFSFAFFILALAVLLGRKNHWLSGFFLAVAGFIQIPLLAAFPIFYIFYSKKVHWKQMLKALVIGLVVFAILYLPNVLLYGTPTQAESESWGYLINVDALRLFADIGAMIIFFCLFFAVDLVKERYKFGPFTKKLIVVFFIGIAIQVIATYRWNIFTALGLAILLVVLFPEKVFKHVYAERLLSILFTVAFWFVFMGMFSMTTSDLALQPMQYLSEHSASNDVTLTDPLFGHSITYYAKTKVVADLAVEYVDEQKLGDSYTFLKEKDYSVLGKYNAKFVVNQGDLINENATLNKPLLSPLEFDKLDKVYSNEFIFIHLNTLQEQ